MSATLERRSPPVKHPTIIDVAARAGVSKTVVSRVMHDDPSVSAARREAVLAAAEALGYRPNAVARSLVQRRTLNVGVIVSDLHNLFFAEILDGIGAAASAAGYQVLITSGNLRRPTPPATADGTAPSEAVTLAGGVESATVSASRAVQAGATPATAVGSGPVMADAAAGEALALETMLQLRTDGIILAGSQLSAEEVRAASRRVPMALVTSAIRGLAVDTVATDDFKGAGLAVDHLVSLGHRVIAMIDGGKGPGSRERRQGYAAAMSEHDLYGFIRIAAGDYTEDGGRRAAAHLLTHRPRPTAIYTANDLAAIGALNAIAEAGLDVPRDISVVGYDNTALAALRHVSLTTVHQPRFQIGEMAMQALLRRLQNPAARARHELLEPSLVIRQTTAPPSRTIFEGVSSGRT